MQEERRCARGGPHGQRTCRSQFEWSTGYPSKNLFIAGRNSVAGDRNKVNHPPSSKVERPRPAAFLVTLQRAIANQACVSELARSFCAP
jgi:hypothetical protein